MSFQVIALLDDLFRLEGVQDAVQVHELLQLGELGLGQGICCLGVGQTADQALADDDIQSRDQQERLDFHVEEARDGAGGAIGVQESRAPSGRSGKH